MISGTFHDLLTYFVNYFGVVYYRDTDRSEGRDTGSSRKERFSLFLSFFLLNRDFHRVLGLGVVLGLGLSKGKG